MEYIGTSSCSVNAWLAIICLLLYSHQLPLATSLECYICNGTEECGKDLAVMKKQTAKEHGHPLCLTSYHLKEELTSRQIQYYDRYTSTENQCVFSCGRGYHEYCTCDTNLCNGEEPPSRASGKAPKCTRTKVRARA